MKQKLEPRRIKADDKIISSVKTIITLFNDKQLSPDEANAVLSMTAAMIMHQIQQTYPATIGREEEMAQVLADSILGNIEILRNPHND